MNPMVIRSLKWQLDLEANCQGPEGEIEENNHENGTSYHNLMLDK
jgi:hypothetical protein